MKKLKVIASIDKQEMMAEEEKRKGLLNFLYCLRSGKLLKYPKVIQGI